MMLERRNAAFTLIELMLVVTVIAIVAAMAIPSLIHARRTANEASAIASLKAIGTANEEYHTRYNAYADALSSLDSSGYLDDHLGGGVKSGYAFDYWSDGIAWDVVAEPAVPGISGNRSFFVDNSGVIRYVEGAVPTSTSPPID